MNRIFISLMNVLLILAFSIKACDYSCSRCDAGSCVECYFGYWGHNCQSKCVNCWVFGCKKHSGKCIQCKPGRYGRHCDMQCSRNCWASKFEDTAYCNRHTGKCLEGCMTGRWGSRCQHKCSLGCQELCYQDDGACISDCKKGFYGTHCNKTCSEGCALGTCDWLSGTCHGGCKCGYSGDRCEDVCSKRCNFPCQYNNELGCLTCDASCGVNCELCNQLTKTCLQCPRGLYGQTCDRECSKNCIGNKCDVYGNCTEGCKEEYYGDKCINKCPSDCKSCNRISSTCLSGKQESSGILGNRNTDAESSTHTTITNAEGHTVERYPVIRGLILAAFAAHAVEKYS